MFTGCFYLWSNISIYVISYFYQFDQSLSLKDVFIVDTMMKVLLNIGYFAGLYLINQQRFHPKIVVIFGASITVTGMILSSFTKSFWVFVVSYGAMYGLGGGTCFMMSL